MSSRDFLRGMSSISLFPAEREGLTPLSHFTFSSDAEAFQHDLRKVGQDFQIVINVLDEQLSKNNKS